MISYFFIISIFAIFVLFILHIFKKRKSNVVPFFFYSGFFYLIIGIPLIPSLLIFLGLFFSAIGVLFLLLQKKSIPTGLQIFLSILPISLYSGYAIYSQPSRNIFLIPEGYKGRVVIIHGCKDGEEREWEQMSRVYRIPESGVLKTKFSFAGNSFDSLHSQYFYLQNSGERVSIPEDPSKIHPHGLWSLQYTKKGDTIIDFILDGLQKDPYSYEIDKNEYYQKEIDSCVE